MTRRLHLLSNRPIRLAAAAVCLSACGMQARSATFEQVAPVLERRCVGCHGPSVQNASVRLDTLSGDLRGDRRAAETWHDVLNALNRGAMPPPGAPPLTAAERSAVVDWLTGELREVAAARRATGGRAVMRRLNRVEYQNTMRHLLGLDLDYSKNLPPDEQSRDGFKNNGAALRMSALQLEYYLQAARKGLRSAIVEGPAPAVHRHRADQSVVDKLKNVNWSARLGRSGVFAARIPDFPDEGEFVVRIRARAELPTADSPYPRMNVSMGYRADTQTPSRTVGLVDVSSERGEEFVFRGRIEEYPLQSRTQSKYPGLLVWIRNAYSDGAPPPEPERTDTLVDGKKTVSYAWQEDSTFPKIIVESIEFQAPVFDAWPPEHHTRLLPRAPSKRSAEGALAKTALGDFMVRAFRRPPSLESVDGALRFFHKIRPTVENFEQAMRETLAMVLVSPDFLYQVETAKPSGTRLDDYELASRLSYFLWSTMPDARLFELAERGALSETKALEGEAERMLLDPRSWALIEQFSDQWLDLAAVDRIAINPNYYPDFDPALKAEMRLESQHFFAEVLRKDLSATNFLRSEFAMANQALAAHYGLAGPRGGAFERVPLAPTRRAGGLLTQGAFLLSNSTGEDSHPIERGIWIRKVLLNDPPAPPPPAVPNLDGAGDSALLPLKQQLERHLDNAACAHCHRSIDPWGIPFEAFDAVGRERTTILRRSGQREQRHPVDAAAILPDGRAVDGVGELIDYLLEHQRPAFARALASKLFVYALGRSIEMGDEETIEELTKEFIESDYRLKNLITMIVTSDAFRGGSK